MLKIDQLVYAYPIESTRYVYDMRIAAGEIVTISGKSGAGKSTLLDLIAGFLVPTSGTLMFDGLDVIPLPPEQRPVAILFQEDNLFDHLSVNANLGLGLPKKTNNAQNKIEQSLLEVDLADFGNRRTRDLSGGQKQRVALARTLLSNKPIVLLDEPFASLDEETADQMRDLVRTLTTRHNWHTLVVSHAQKDSAQLADRAYLLAHGELSLLQPS